MGKAAIQAQINGLNEALRGLNSEIAELEEATKTLSGVSIDFEYVLGDAESIEEEYNLGGEKYEELATQEKSTVDTIKKNFQGHKDTMLSQLVAKTLSKAAEVAGLSAKISILEVQKSLTKEN
ncbi:septum formation initiator [Streptococcus sanguinis]|uniref:septum formation initiator n=1 Tax=Streptococcus sanguinis TaxID=1305 RepID=UPI0039C4DD05